jgi:Domain of unknown function (DUF4405)
VVNLALLFAMTLCVASGIAISRVALPELGLYTLQSPFWFRLHALTAEVTVGLVPVHVALRWRWIAALAWNHFAPSLPGEGPAGEGPALVVRGHIVKRVLPGGKLAPGAKPLPAGRAPPGIRENNGSGIPGLMLGDLLEPVNLAVLRHTAFLEAAVIAAVVIADAGYRRLRRARRART